MNWHVLLGRKPALTCIYCVVPENIHTLTTEGIPHCTLFPWDFPISKNFLNLPPLQNFLKYKIHPHTLLEKFSLKRMPQMSVFCEHFKDFKNCPHEEKICVIKELVHPFNFTGIIVVYHIYLWSLTSNFTISFTEDFKSKFQKSSETSPATQDVFSFACLCSYAIF